MKETDREREGERERIVSVIKTREKNDFFFSESRSSTYVPGINTSISFSYSYTLNTEVMRPLIEQRPSAFS